LIAWVPSLIALQQDEYVVWGRHSRMLGGPETSPFIHTLLAISLGLLLTSLCLRNRDWVIHTFLWVVAAFLADRILLASTVYNI
jgi:hypothetical protein